MRMEKHSSTGRTAERTSSLALMLSGWWEVVVVEKEREGKGKGDGEGGGGKQRLHNVEEYQG